jgi:hypothetical protein
MGQKGGNSCHKHACFTFVPFFPFRFGYILLIGTSRYSWNTAKDCVKHQSINLIGYCIRDRTFILGGHAFTIFVSQWLRSTSAPSTIKEKGGMGRSPCLSNAFSWAKNVFFSYQTKTKLLIFWTWKICKFFQKKTVGSEYWFKHIFIDELHITFFFHNTI